MVAKITAVLKLIRVRQWVKNLFVFAPLVFSLQLLKQTAEAVLPFLPSAWYPNPCMP